MNENLKKIVNCDFIYLLIFFSLSYRFFFTLEFNSIGHHWDFIFPISKEIVQGGANLFIQIFHILRSLMFFVFHDMV